MGSRLRTSISCSYAISTIREEIQPTLLVVLHMYRNSSPHITCTILLLNYTRSSAIFFFYVIEQCTESANLLRLSYLLELYQVDRDYSILSNISAIKYEKYFLCANKLRNGNCILSVVNSSYSTPRWIIVRRSTIYIVIQLGHKLFHWISALTDF